MRTDPFLCIYFFDQCFSVLNLKSDNFIFLLLLFSFNSPLNSSEQTNPSSSVRFEFHEDKS